MTTTPSRTRTLRIWIPGAAVSVNAMYQRTARGRVCLTQPARAWKNYVEQIVMYEALVAGFPTRDHLRDATIWYEFHKPRGDADNLVKLTQDGIAAGLGVNDRIFQVGSVTREWTGKSDQTGVWVTIEANVATVGNKKRKGAA